MYRSCDTDTLINCLGKMALPVLAQKTIGKIREETSAQVAQVSERRKVVRVIKDNVMRLNYSSNMLDRLTNVRIV